MNLYMSYRADSCIFAFGILISVTAMLAKEANKFNRKSLDEVLLREHCLLLELALIFLLGRR